MVKATRTPVDSSVSFTVSFTSSYESPKGTTGSKLNGQAILSCSIMLDSFESGVVIRCERGNILVRNPIYCPKEFVIQYRGENGEIEREEASYVKEL